MDFSVKISEISDKNFLSVLEQKFRTMSNDRLELYKIITKICEDKGSTIKGSRTHKICLNSKDFWFEEPLEILDAINQLREIDKNLKNIIKLRLANQVNLDTVQTEREAQDLILQIKLLANTNSAGVFVKGTSTQVDFIIDELKQTRANIIAKTEDKKCVKKYHSEEVFSRELKFLQHYAHCPFMPEIIDFNKTDLLLIMPWLDHIDIENGPNMSGLIQSALDLMEQEGIRHNDINIFEEVFCTDGKLAITDWEMGTIGTEVPKKIRVYEDGCLFDAYSFLRSDQLFEYDPVVTLTSTILNPTGRNADYFKVAAYAISRANIKKFEKLEKLCEASEVSDLHRSNFVHVSLIFKKNTCKIFDKYKPIQGLADVKKALDAQAIFSTDYMLKLWRYWWQKKFSSNESNPVFQFRRAGMKYRDKLISQQFRNLQQQSVILDIGSNAGEVSYFLSSLGFSIIGFEPDPEVWKISIQKNIKNCVLYNSELDLSKISIKSPSAAVLLSVFHRIWALKGPDAAKMELQKIAENVDLILFEGSSHLQRYGQIKPPFGSNDIDNCHNWHVRIFEEILPNWTANFIDTIPHTSTEPLRLFYTLKRKQRFEFT